MNDSSSTSSVPNMGFRSAFFVVIVSMTVFGLSWIIIAWGIAGRGIAEKVTTSLVQPAGFLWMLLFGLLISAISCRSLKAVLGLGLAWMILTLGGNGLVAGKLLSQLEEQYQPLRPFEAQPYDVIVLLGGGTSFRPEGQMQLSFAGDRVMMAARMYHRQMTEKLICTGESMKPGPTPESVGEATGRLLKEIGVGEEDLIYLPGVNTSEEMRYLKQWSEEHPEMKRIGVVTSAWHMSRVETLAAKEGLQIEPIPSDFISHQDWDIRAFIPTGGALSQVGMAMKEEIARLIGR